MKNIQDVINQLQSNHLRIENPIIDGRIHRCLTDIDKKKDRGWYVLYELRCDNGDILITGSCGYWQGNENNELKIELTGHEVSKAEQKLIKQKQAETKKQQDAETKARHEKAAAECEVIWNNAKPHGDNDYFQAKQIQAHGLRFTDEGAALVPMCDVAGRIRSLQYIYDSHSDFVKQKKRNKDFHYGGGKKGFHHLIGGIPTTVLLVAEGYATAATLHEATNLPVAVCFDAGNIAPVVEAFRKRYWNKINILICADNDDLANCMECKAVINLSEHQTTCPSCGKAHKRTNSGVKSANDAAFLHNAAVIIPEFPNKIDRFNQFLNNKTKFSDFNDLSMLHGLHTIRTQIDIFLEQKKWKLKNELQAYDKQGEIKLIDTAEEGVNRFAFIYGTDDTFDFYEKKVIPFKTVGHLFKSRDIYKMFNDHHQKRVLRPENIGFDPTGLDKKIIGNLFDGLETQPIHGKCEAILDLLMHLCGGMTVDGVKDYKWILKWLAYPLQNVGAKMRTALIIHGLQGIGKNLFFDLILKMYGKYGAIIGQEQLESPFNSWASHKLFLVANEVAPSNEKYHSKNKLKALITEDSLMIRSLYVNPYSESNHMNIVFLSNDLMPVVIEDDDRRHMVIWCGEKPDLDFFEDVYAEINNGGVEALLSYLTYEVDCTGFNEHTKPLLNHAKKQLVNLCLDNASLFFQEWSHEEIEGLEFVPIPTQKLYELYRAWCSSNGVKAASKKILMAVLQAKNKCYSDRARVIADFANSQNPISVTFHDTMRKMPEGMSQGIWLGDCLKKCNDAMSRLTTRNL
jgi:putative DNA primase/helicase